MARLLPRLQAIPPDRKVPVLTWTFSMALIQTGVQWNIVVERECLGIRIRPTQGE